MFPVTCLSNFFFVYSKHVRNCMEPFLRMFPLGVLDPRIVQTRSIIAREVAFKLWQVCVHPDVCVFSFVVLVILCLMIWMMRRRVILGIFECRKSCLIFFVGCEWYQAWHWYGRDFQVEKISSTVNYQFKWFIRLINRINWRRRRGDVCFFLWWALGAVS